MGRRVFSIACAVFAAVLVCSCARAEKKRLVFAYGGSVHLWGEHEHGVMCRELARMANESMRGLVEASCADMGNGFDFSRLEKADAVVVICEGEQNHPLASKTALLKRLNDRGLNVGVLHYGLMFSSDADNAALDSIVGGHYRDGFSYNPFFEAKFDVGNAEHCVLNGVSSFGFYDEWHFNIYFGGAPGQKITPVLKTAVPDFLRRRRSAPVPVREGFGKGRLETAAWLAENANGTRGFGFTGGHSPWSLAQKDFRKVLLNMCAWLAGVDVPSAGFDARAPDFDSIAAGIKKPERPDRENYLKKTRAAFDAWIGESAAR